MYAIRSYYAHSSYLTPDMLKQVEVETKGVFGGLGIEIGIKDGILTIIAPIEDTPADRAGLLAGDRITSYNVCYTKLLRIRDREKAEKEPPGSLFPHRSAVETPVDPPKGRTAHSTPPVVSERGLAASGGPSASLLCPRPGDPRR